MPRLGLDPIVTGEDDASLVDYGFLDAATAGIQSTFRRDLPTFGLLRQFDIEAEAGAITTAEYAGGPIGALAGEIRRTFYRPTPVVSKDEALAKLEAANLTGAIEIPEAGLTQGALDLLMEYKRDELENAFILENYRGGMTGNAAVFGLQFLTAVADPINVASAFVPVVGEARYAALLSRAGTSLASRAGVRAGVGAVEGTVGAALVEPFLYASNQEIQADYSVADSLLNIGFGSVFGGVLQPGFGGLADLWARRNGTGAWAENLTPTGERDLPDLPPGVIGGGGTRFIDGDDYVRGQWQVVDASTLTRPAAEALGDVDPGQVATSPWAGSGAPVLRADGTVDGNRRLATVLDAYANGRGEAYRAEVLAQAAGLGFDPRQIEGIANPVLVRRETGREVGRWGEERAIVESLPAAKVAVDEPPRVETLDADGNVVGVEPVALGASVDVQAKVAESLSKVDAGGVLLNMRDGYRVAATGDGTYSITPMGEAEFEPMRGLTRTEAQKFLTDKYTAQMERQAVMPTREQADAAMRIGVAQAVNGKLVDVTAVRELDGTREGVERFLEARRIAEEAEAAAVAQREEAISRAIAEGQRVKVEDEVAQAEEALRMEMRATGADEAEIDEVLAEFRLLEEDAQAEAIALNGIELCMMRNA